MIPGRVMFWIVLAVGAAASSVGRAAPGEQAADLFECEVCHLMSLKDFKSRRITTLIPYIGAVKAWGVEGNLWDAVNYFIDEGARDSVIDFGLHCSLVAGDIKTQTERVLENVKAILDDQKLTFANVVKSTVFLTNLAGAGHDGSFTT